VASERPDPIERVLPAAVAPVRTVLLSPAEREAERRRRERARAARAPERDDAGAAEPDAPEGAPPRLDVRG
jgi:hypothetical protein